MVYPRDIVAKILLNLDSTKGKTGSSIGKKIGYDGRTTEKYLELLESLWMVKKEEIELGRRKIRLWTTTENYYKMLAKKTKKKEVN